MNIKAFLDALSVVAFSPYALVGYVLVVVVFGASLWNSRRLHIIAERLKDLPEGDRLKALELEYRIVPKGGLDSNAFLTLKGKQYKLAIVIAVLLVVVLIACLATYRAVEGARLSSALRSMSVALAVTKLGKLSAESNQFAIAAGNLEAALQAFPSETGYANLGYIYEELSNTHAAILAYTKAVELAPSNGDVHNSLGFLYKDSDQFELATTHLKRARELSTEGDELWFMVMINSGNILYESGRSTNEVAARSQNCRHAISEYYLPALKYRGALKNQDMVARALANLANCYKDVGQLGDARDALQEAVSIKRRTSASRSLAETLVNMADLLLKEERYEQAKPYLLEATPIFVIVQNHFGLGTAYFNLGDIMWAHGNVGEAKRYYEQSIESFSIAHAGGEYEQAPKRRLERMRMGDLPEFVRRASEKSSGSGFDSRRVRVGS